MQPKTIKERVEDLENGLLQARQECFREIKKLEERIKILEDKLFQDAQENS